jgi:hypothetical protein
MDHVFNTLHRLNRLTKEGPRNPLISPSGGVSATDNRRIQGALSHLGQEAPLQTFCGVTILSRRRRGIGRRPGKSFSVGTGK